MEQVDPPAALRLSEGLGPREAYSRWLADTHAPALRQMDSEGAYLAAWDAATRQCIALCEAVEESLGAIEDQQPEQVLALATGAAQCHHSLRASLVRWISGPNGPHQRETTA